MKRVEYALKHLSNMRADELAEFADALSLDRTKVFSGVATMGGKRAVALDSYGENKIQAIKVVREATGLSLKAAKELVDSTPMRFGEFRPEQAAGIVTDFAKLGMTARVVIP